MKNTTVRTRFAPSPTGFLHVGGLRTALYSYLFAKQNGGRFILRLEDTDLKRFVESAAEAIYSGLKWAGIEYDEGPGKDGPFGPYIQSQRLEIYKKYALELVKKGTAYYCFCGEETLKQMREEQAARKLAPKYDRRCQKLSQEQIETKLESKEPFVIRMKIPEGRKIEFDDIVRGKISYNSDELDDQVLPKSDGYPTYHLAVVVDDHLMQISHVTRTEEWLPSTPKHILLYEYLGWEIPRFAHLPLLLNTDKTKMSKRKGDVAVEDYIKKGYLPQAMINYLALLGWNPGLSPEVLAKGEHEQEMFSMQELIRNFDLHKVHKAGAVFDIEKLNWFNSQYLRKFSDEELLEKTRPYLPNTKDFSNEQIIRMLNLEKERSATLAAIGESVKFYFNLPEYESSLLKWKDMADSDIKKSLETSREIISQTDEQSFTSQKLSEVFLEKAKGFKNRGELLWPLRASLSGQKFSPPPFDILEILGKGKSSERINAAIEKIS